VNQTEVEAGGRLYVINDVGIVAGVEARQLHLDARFAHLADERLGHAERVDAVADDLDRLGDFLLPRVRVGRLVVRPVDRLEREGDAAGEIETERKPALRAAEQLVQNDVVPLLCITEGGLQLDVRKELREVDLALLADLLEGDEIARGLEVLFPRGRLLQQLAQLRLFGGGVGADVVGERDIMKRDDLRGRPYEGRRGDDELPEVAFEHGSFGFKGGGRGRRRACEAAPSTSGPRRGRSYFFSSAFALRVTACTKPLPSSILVVSDTRTTKRSSFTFVITP